MSRLTRRKTLWLLGAGGATVVLGAGVPAYYLAGNRGGGEKPLALLPKTTSKITRQTLTQATTVPGKLGYGESAPLTSQAAGIVTWLPAAGEVISRGGTLFRANEEPVVLMYGALPMYRPLAVGTKGPDVTQFKQNLRVLNYSGVSTDDSFTKSTEGAVKRWQKALQLPQTGIVEMSRISYASAAVRIARLTVRVGASATGEVLAYTGTTRVVTVDVPAGQATWAVTGTAVTVTLPGSKSVAGEISSVGTEASSPEDEGSGAAEATIPVTVSIVDQAVLGSLDKSPVDVSYLAQRRENVLVVPVAALLALAEGGYGLEIVEGQATRIVAIETGMTANGLIEVRGDALADGMTIGIAG